MESARWPDAAVVYQLYPRSFADHDGDGVGDLRGIRARLSHLVDLGVDAVWLNPCYPSPLADGGYDVSDPRAVDPRLGSVDDLRALAADLARHGIALVLDLVPNHVSVEHPWFRAAIAAGPGSRERELFHFADGNGDEPPNDWRSAFGGPAWTRVTEPDGSPGQWYFHLHAPEQPDLNWDDEQVRADFDETLRFWAGLGVRGFRIDVANTLLKDLSSPLAWDELTDRPTDDGQHPTSDRSGLDELHARWRRVLREFDPEPVLVAEAAATRVRRRRYATNLGQAFNFDAQDADFSVADYRRVIADGLADSAATGRPTSWLMGSHDTPRIATRLGLPARPGQNARRTAVEWLLTDGTEPTEDRELGRRRLRATLLLQLALPGVFYLFQGDELGLPEVGDLPSEALQDPLAHRSGGAEKGRDGTRVPLPWSTLREAAGGSSFGFGPGGSHLPQPDWFGSWSVEAQEDDPGSVLQLTRRAIILRREIDPAWPTTLHDEPGEVVHLTRGPLEVWTNFGTSAVPLAAGRIWLASTRIDDQLPPASTVWLRHD